MKQVTFLKGRALLLVTLIVVLCSISITHVSAQDETTILVSESPIEIPEEDIGKLFNITVVIENVPQDPGAVGVEFKLRWKSTVLEGVSMVLPPGHFMTPDGDDDNLMIVKDEVNLVYPNTTDFYAHYAVYFMDLPKAIETGYAPKYGDGTLAIITFNSTAAGETDLTFFAIKVGGTPGEIPPPPVIETTGINGSVIVIPEFPAFIIPLLFMAATALAIISRKKLKKQNSTAKI